MSLREDKEIQIQLYHFNHQKSKEPELKEFSCVDKSILKSKDGGGRALSNLCVLTKAGRHVFWFFFPPVRATGTEQDQ